MKSTLEWHGTRYEWSINQAIDITRLIDPIGGPQTRCFYAPPAVAEPLTYGITTLSTASGAPVNSFNLHINIHGTGTHTETSRHIDGDGPVLSSIMNQFLFVTRLITIQPRQVGTDHVITRSDLVEFNLEKNLESVVIRTLADHSSDHDYSGTNPPYFDPDAVAYLAELGIRHLVIDLPSVDREEDGGKVLSHKTFWDKSRYTDRENCTITELVHISEDIKDGLYLLSINPIKLALDAAMSRVVLYQLHHHDSTAK